MSGLEELLANATPGPWEWMGGYPQRITNTGAILVAETFDDPDSIPHTTRLIALAPDLARLALDMGEALETAMACCARPAGTCGDFPALLARLDGLVAGKETAE